MKFFKRNFQGNFKMIDGWGISCEIDIRWLSQDLADVKSPLVQVMAWCHPARRHYLNQCWPSSTMPYGATRPHWLNVHSWWCHCAWIGEVLIIHYGCHSKSRHCFQCIHMNFEYERWPGLRHLGGWFSTTYITSILTQLLLKPEYSWRNRAIAIWLLMPRLLVLPGHQ